MPVIHELNHAFKLADNAWSAELVRMFGKQAGDARYDERGTSTDTLSTLYQQFEVTGEAWRNAIAESRKPITRETLVFSCIHSHRWPSERFTDSFHPQVPNCPQCNGMWTHVVDTVPSSLVVQHD